MPKFNRPLLTGLAILLPTVLGGCAEAPFVDSDYRYNQQGQVRVCYSPANSTPQQVAAMAEEVCNRYHRTAIFWMTQKGQCSWTAPNVSTFYCVARPGETPPPFVDKRSPLRRDESSN